MQRQLLQVQVEISRMMLMTSSSVTCVDTVRAPLREGPRQYLKLSAVRRLPSIRHDRYGR